MSHIEGTFEWVKGVRVDWFVELDPDDDPKRPNVGFRLRYADLSDDEQPTGEQCTLDPASGDLIDWPFWGGPMLDLQDLLQDSIGKTLAVCPVCDELACTTEHQGCCSDDCLTTFCERSHEAFCDGFYGGSGPVTAQERWDAVRREKL
jgi:hypothetical protein